MVRHKDAMKVYGLGPNEEILTFERGEDGTIRTKAELLITSLYYTVMWISMLASNGNIITVPQDQG